MMGYLSDRQLLLWIQKRILSKCTYVYLYTSTVHLSNEEIQISVLMFPYRPHTQSK